MIDRARPEWPREVEVDHLLADLDHNPEPYSGYGDDVMDNCRNCGLAVTSDGERHGTDA